MRFVVARLWHSAIVLLAVALLVFILMRLTGDPVAVMLPAEATEQDAEIMRREFGLDRPVYEQFGIFLVNALRGNFGQSYRHHQPALGLVLERLPATLWLTFAAMAVSLLLAIPAGIISALTRGSIFDSISRLIALVGQAMPTFWLGLMLILLFAVRLRWLPPAGNGGPEYVILPAITLGAYSAALTMRLLRSSLLEVLGRDYIRTARAKGLADKTVIARHALKNAAIPVVTVIGLQVGRLLAGSVVTETVFGYGGMGLLAVQAILGRDLTIVQAFVIVSAIIILAINLMMDLLYAALDPRIRYGQGSSLMATETRTGQGVVATPVPARRNASQRLDARLLRSPQAMVALFILVAVILSALLAPWIAPADPLAQDITRRFRPPIWEEGGTTENILGTDSVGRDLLSRLMHGGRVSLLVGLSAVLVQGGMGVLLGLLAGYYGGRWDSIIMRLADVQLAVPTLILAIAVIAVLGPSLQNVIIVLGVTNWVIYGRVVRSEALTIRRREFVEAARVVGSSDLRLIFRHVLPNVAASVIVITTLEVAQMIIAEASLSFLGLGVQPPTPTWGGMIAEGRTYIGTRWWLSTVPGLMILLTVLALNLFGDWLRDVLDPTLRRLE